MITIIRLEIDFFNKKARQKLEAENFILKQQLANFRNEIIELNRRRVNEPSRPKVTNIKQKST